MTNAQNAWEATSEQTDARTPISCLPNELIAHILELVTQADPLHISHEGLRNGRRVFLTGPAQLAWVRCTHVCRLWREIALGDAGLWANQVGLLPRASETFLERAGDDVPLRFFLFHQDTNMSLVEKLCAHTHRVETIKWRVADGQGPEGSLIEKTLAGRTFEALQLLDVRTTYVWPLGPKPAPLRAERLERVTFLGHYVPLIAPRLTHLKLELLENRHADGKGVLELLRGCPLLERVELVGYNTSWDSTFERLPTESPPVELARLRHLTLHLHIPACLIAAFIGYLDMPATVDICVRRGKFSGHTDDALFERAFAITAIDGERTILSFEGQVMSLASVATGRAKLSLNTGEIRRFESALDGLFIKHHLRRVSHLRVSPYEGVDVTFWERIFDRLPRVTRLEVATNRQHPRASFDTIFAALGRAPTCTLPELTAIFVDETVRHTVLSIKEDVIACLLARREAEARQLATLELQGFKRDEEALESLGNLVEQPVGWKAPSKSELKRQQFRRAG